jgi:hypothetical protein
MWDIKTGNLVKTFENCKAHIMSIDITTDGQHVIVLSYDENKGQAIKVLDIETGELIHRINPEG